MARSYAGDPMEIRQLTGKLIGVGLGPGDPELVTLKAARLISSAQVVTYPEPAGGQSFARSIAAALIPEAATEIPIPIPMQESRFPAQDVYRTAAERIARRLEEGTDVVALCQGDPFFYGSFMFLFSRLAARFPVTVVPGVPSLAACAAAAAQPLCARMEALSVLPAPMDEPELERRLAKNGAAVIVKLGRHLAKARRVLERLHLSERAVYVAHATLPQQQVLPLAQAPEDAPYFSMILVPGRDPYGSG